MPSVLDAIAEVRFNVNDVNAGRYTNATIVGFINAGRREIFSIRPDLKPLPRATAPVDVAESSQLDIEGKAYNALIFYVTSRCEMSDDEHVNSNRMALALSEFKAKLVSNQ
jgi:hypothetical protein